MTSWSDIGTLSDTVYAFNRYRIVFKTKNGKLILITRDLQQWHIDKYAITEYIILPE